MAQANREAVKFQSTPHERSDSGIGISCANSIISIHAPTRRATIVNLSEYIAYSHISIHAPTRGATGTKWLKMPYFKISIHAPTIGATIKPHSKADGVGFQSTLPR